MGDFNGEIQAGDRNFPGFVMGVGVSALVVLIFLCLCTHTPPPANGPLFHLNPPLNLKLIVSKDGFYLHRNGKLLPPVQGCHSIDEASPTICLEHELSEDGGITRYNWRALYNLLMIIRSETGPHQILQLQVAAGEKIPSYVISAVLDTSQCRLGQTYYHYDEDFLTAMWRSKLEHHVPLPEQPLAHECRGYLFPNVLMVSF